MAYLMENKEISPKIPWIAPELTILVITSTQAAPPLADGDGAQLGAS